ncbi:MAG: NAD(P)/FAD-dependent oxidoreductase [Burkholderiales bacterium]
MPYDPLTASDPGTGLDYMPSYWTSTADVRASDDGPLEGTTDVDVVIIGGGYTGLSCAYHLARHYGIRATVLEANRPGWGCSSRNGGFARAAIGRHSFGKMIERWGRGTARRVFGQALSALDTVRSMIREGGISCDALEAGHLKIAHRPSRAAALAREAELLQREFEYPAEFLTGAQLRSEHIGGSQSHAALRFPDAVAVHPLKLVLGVLDMARAAGAKVHSGSPVLKWQKNGYAHILRTPSATVRARSVVLATNGYTPEHLHDCVRATTLPVLSHIIVTRAMTAEEKVASGFRTEHVLTDTRNLLYYWRRLPDDRILFGGRGRITESAAGQVAHRDFLLAELKAKLPALGAMSVDYDWWGWVCLTADFLPHVYHAADDASVHYALGYQGSGVSYALFAGKILASRVANDVSPDAIPATTTPLPRFPFAALRRVGQRAMYQWYRYSDNRG